MRAQISDPKLISRVQFVKRDGTHFHIVRPEAPDDILLLFGKHSKAGNLTTFSLDFCQPLSCLAAFGIVLTTFGDSQ